MATKIADLAVRIGADVSELRRGLSQADSAVDKFAAVGKKAAMAFAAAIVTATTAVAGLAMKGVALGDELQRVAGTLGLTATEMAGLHHAARLANVETGTLDSGLARLGKTVSEAGTGSKVASNALRALGLDAKELAKLPLSEQMLRVSESMEGVRNQTDKLRLSSELFGRGAGASMLNLFRQGTQAIREQLEEAKRFGMYMDGTQNRVVAEAADSQDRLKSAFEGFTLQLGAEFAPAIKAANEFITTMLTKVTAMLPKLAALAERFLGIKRAAEDMGDASIREAILQNVLAIQDLEEGIAKTRETARHQQPGVFDSIIAGMEAEKAALQKRLDELLREKVARQSKPEEPPAPAGGTILEDNLDEAARHELDLVTAVFQEKERVRVLEKEQEFELLNALAEERERIHGMDIDLLWNGVEESRKANEVKKEQLDDLAKYEKMTLQQRAATVTAGLVQITGIMSSQSKKMFEVHKKLALAQAIVSLPQAVLEAVKNGGGLPWGAIPGAITAALGLAQINAIKSAKFDGGGGSSAAVGSGGGGAAAAAAPAPGPAAGQRLLVEGLSSEGLFDSRMVRALAEKLLQHQRDGGEVVLR